MAMPYADYADVIKWNAVKELCPMEAQALQAALERYQIDEWDLAHGFGPDPDGRNLDVLTGIVAESLDCGDNATGQSGGDTDALAEKAVTEVTAAWKALQDAFKNATGVGDSYLTLNIDFRCPGAGGSDEEDVEGVFYYVRDAYQLTPAGKKFEDKLDRHMFVDYC